MFCSVMFHTEHYWGKLILEVLFIVVKVFVTCESKKYNTTENLSEREKEISSLYLKS